MDHRVKFLLIILLLFVLIYFSFFKIYSLISPGISILFPHLIRDGSPSKAHEATWRNAPGAR